MGARHLCWLLGLAACFSPTVPEGAPCQLEEHCPRPQHCVAGSCRLSPHSGDAATDGRTSIDSATDAPFTLIDAAIDAPLPLGCSMTGFNCPNGYVLNACNGACFIRCNAVTTRTEAINRCAAWNGQLATFDTAAAITCALGSNTPASWIGLTQSPNNGSLAVGWTWVGGAALANNAPWSFSQPDDGDGVENAAENCATATGATFEDVSCAVTRGFICRR